jgi:cell wall assembly regulator SMI1
VTTSNVEAPLNIKKLDSAITAVAKERGVTVRRIQRSVANTILGQLLPAGVVKGGTGIKLRFGEAASRYTPDFDTALKESLEDFEDALADALAKGWSDFTGRLVKRPKRAPEDVAEQYVMQPYEVKMQYRSKDWRTIDLELGHDEIGCTAEPELRMPDDVRDVFARLGLPEPEPIPVLALDHQIAQKLHACTFPGNDRAHDLVDLQLLVRDWPDLAAVGATAERLFRFRKRHAWPPNVKAGPNWIGLYTDAATGLDVLQDLDAALAWTNQLIEDVVRASQP